MAYSIGIDSGSTATKGILLADGVITRRFLVPTPFRPATAITEAWETLREGLETTPFLTLTGYGRQLVDFADKQVTEISCHGLGARFLAPATRAVIDIGGQDSKVIQLDDAMVNVGDTMGSVMPSPAPKPCANVVLPAPSAPGVVPYWRRSARPAARLGSPAA